jgi:antibiotic biosynthesis monooxygenase (ABM) superfamily enzyme
MTQQEPKKWKFALLIWLFIFPFFSLLSMLLMPFMTNLHPLFKNLIMSLILVPIMSWYYIPFINKKYFNWLRK